MLELLTLLVLVPGVPVDDQTETPVVIDPMAEIELLEEVEEFVYVFTKQELLDDLGWYEGAVDGIYGPLTEQATEEFLDAVEVEDDLDRSEVLNLLRDDEAPSRPVPVTARSGGGVASEEGIAVHWLALADCESGDWDANANPIPGSRRWNYGAPGAFVRPNYPFHGGLNFAPSTWRWVAGEMNLLSQYPNAYDAPPRVQVEVGIETQRRQGWSAWPVCSRKVGLR